MNRGDWQAKLSERACGGCLETAELAADFRDEIPSPDTTRRTVLRRIGQTAVIGGLSAALATPAAASPGIGSENGRGSSRGQAIRAAVQHRPFNQLLWYFRRYRGFESTGQFFAGEKDGTLIVNVPFKVDHEHDQRAVAFVQGEDGVRMAEGMAAEHVHTDEPHWKVARYRVENGDLVEETRDIPNFLGCDDPNIACIAGVAGAYAANVTACAICVSSAGWLIPACAYCLAATLSGIGIVAECHDGWCND